MKHELRLGVDGFRVMTPPTTQITTLQKDGGANPGSIMYSKSLYVEDPAFKAGSIRLSHRSGLWISLEFRSHG
jgi:hypothetical protein